MGKIIESDERFIDELDSSFVRIDNKTIDYKDNLSYTNQTSTLIQ